MLDLLVEKLGLAPWFASYVLLPGLIFSARILDVSFGTIRVMFSYETHANAGSRYNTPPCFAIYMAGKVFEWLLDLGGVPAMEEVNREKASWLYDFLDDSKIFNSTVEGAFRSIMNVPFILPSDELNAKFIKEATGEGLTTLKGHRTVGGMRASIYNAMPPEGVKKLVEFMKKFEVDNS